MDDVVRKDAEMHVGRKSSQEESGENVARMVTRSERRLVGQGSLARSSVGVVRRVENVEVWFGCRKGQ